MVLLVGEHQEAPIINEDTDEVLGKKGSVIQLWPCPQQGRASRVEVPGCQAGGPAWCSQASEASQCRERQCWVQGAGDTTHPGGLTALSEGPWGNAQTFISASWAESI